MNDDSTNYELGRDENALIGGEDEQPTIESILGDDPKLKEAFARAEQGFFQHVVLEHWESQLKDEIKGYEEDAALEVYQMFLDTFRWLRYQDIEKVRALIRRLMEESLLLLLDVIDAAVAGTPETKEDIYASLETDWEDNDEIYVEVLAQWTALTWRWGNEWQAAHVQQKPLLHAAIAVAQGRLFGDKGLHEQIRWVKDFMWGDNHQEQMVTRIQELVKEGGDE
jgi:hypothetical protein